MHEENENNEGFSFAQARRRAQQNKEVRERTRAEVNAAMPLSQAEEARDKAILQVEDNASDEWLQQARAAVLKAAGSTETFTTDDVWRLLGGGAETHEPRAMGAVMAGMARAGFIRTVDGQYRKSTSTVCHARPKQVWRKWVHRPETVKPAGLFPGREHGYDYQ